MQNHFAIRILVVAFGLSMAAGCFFQPQQEFHTHIPNIRRDQIFSQPIDKATDLLGLPKLRDVRLPDDDIEIRIWRGFGLSPLEGVFLRRTDGVWSGIHLTSEDYADAKNVESRPLNPPKSGWDSFWKKLTAEGLTTIQQSAMEECSESGIDGVGYEIEINSDYLYRNYYYREGNKKCEEARQTERIGETIGLEFDTGQDECRTAEWFPCMTYRKLHEQ